MNRETLCQLIKLLHESMEQLTVDAGVSPEIYQTVIQFNDETTDAELEALHTWLTIICEGTYEAVVRVWKLHPRTRWQYYYAMGEELTELKLLNKVRRDLYTEWKKPYFIKRRKHEIHAKSDS